MKRRTLIQRGMQFALVTVGIVALTSFSIDATDTLRGSQTALSILAGRVSAPTCPVGMVPVTDTETPFCLDVYEAGVGDLCLVPEPGSPSETALNAVDADCSSVSVPGVLPWRFVTILQAEQLCARVGKRLPTAAEWHHAARGTVDADLCNQNSALAATGGYASCQSGVGAFDMVGNVWEFVQGDVQSGVFNQVALPEAGYVLMVDHAGVPSRTTTTPQTIYNDDYFWASATGTYAMMRGGYYSSGSDGGLYSAHAMIGRDFSSGAIGFRCVSSL